jgi:hypothetical protein
MGQTGKRSRQNRTITVDFHNEATYVQPWGDGKAFVECVVAFLLALGFQLAHKASCRGGGCLTRHAHYLRVRLGVLTLWRVQCTTCKAVFTVLPHFVLRYHQMPPEVARDALLATHGSLSLELCVVIGHISPMALYRLICALGQVTSALLDQAHNALERKLFAIKGFHHLRGSQQAFLIGVAHLYNLVPYQRRAQHAGQCGVEWKAGAYRHATGSTICKFSPREAYAERGRPSPQNAMECGKKRRRLMSIVLLSSFSEF